MSGATYYLNGKEVTAKAFRAGGKQDWLKASPMIANTYNEHDPLLSDGCGVMKAQVPETREAIKQHGIQGAQVHNDGKIRFTSRTTRREFLKMRGLHDNDGGYGDG